MSPPNRKLQKRREAMPSPAIAGQPMSRAELAEAVNHYLWRVKGQRRELDAHTIARYERGAVRWPGSDYREALCAILRGSVTDLGFAPRRRAKGDNDVDEMFDVGLSGPFASESVSAGRPAGLRTTGRVGGSDVDRVRSAAREMARMENRHGGGTATDSVTRHLQRFAPLLRRSASPATKRALFEAIGNLGAIAGYSAFDIAEYTDADRNFRFALWCADSAASWELRAATLADMARMAAYIGNPDGALSLVELAQVRSDRLTHTTCAMLAAVRAQYLSALGRIDEALSEVARGDEHMSASTPDADPPWMCYYDEAEHLGSTGKALIPAAVGHGRIELSADRLHRAVQLQGEDYPRSRAFSLTRLATLSMRIGDPRTAAGLGMQAVAAAEGFRSGRMRDELVGLVDVAARHRRIREVAEMREAVSTVSHTGAGS
ncbi:XRE family transcriptional regulator [Nocardia sp. NPDC003963]